MNATVFTRSPKPPAKALPDKIALLMHEARWLLVGAFGIYLSLVLWGFDRADTGWSHVSASSAVANPGGRAGAWLADYCCIFLACQRGDLSRWQRF
ncbi:MAG: DNA translocase FtsK 4TM domain-containing protein [Rhodocyclaceae bacterium]|nr:DNA translocase FtsK 4TM domain-containing protein [Rhodocyclaceae bacterium]